MCKELSALQYYKSTLQFCKCKLSGSSLQCYQRELTGMYVQYLGEPRIFSWCSRLLWMVACVLVQVAEARVFADVFTRGFEVGV